MSADELPAEKKEKFERIKQEAEEHRRKKAEGPHVSAEVIKFLAADPSGAKKIVTRVERAEETRGLTKKKNKMPASLDNAVAALTKLGVKFRYDEFHDRYLVSGVKGKEHDLTDQVILLLRRRIIENFKKFDPGDKAVRDAALWLALQNSFDPVLDYLSGLKWDGVERLDRWLAVYMRAEDNELISSFGRVMLCAMVRRAKQPGCKFDFIPVLEGEQGLGKSTALKILAGGEDNFTDEAIMHLDTKGQQEQLTGKWIAEEAELGSMRKTEVENVKRFASKTYDRARPAYGHFRMDVPRRCVIVATTNDDQYLQDQTGNRRFWPVRVGRVDLEGLERDRDQLLAEAVVVEPTLKKLEIPERLWAWAAEEQEKRMQPSQWADQLMDLETHACVERTRDAWRVSTDTLFSILRVENPNDVDAKRLAGVMKRLKWTGPKLIRFDKPRRGYEKPRPPPKPPAVSFKELMK